MYIMGRTTTWPSITTGAVLNLVHAENCALRGIDDRRRQQRPEHPAIGDGERAAREFFYRDGAGAGAGCEIRDRFFDLGEAQQIRIAQNGHDQAAIGRYRDADIEIFVIDDVVAFHRGVD